MSLLLGPLGVYPAFTLPWVNPRSTVPVVVEEPRGTDNSDAPAPAGGFPTQYDGWQIKKAGSWISLCLVAVADAPVGMGGCPQMWTGSVWRAVYLVDVSDPNASPVQLRTSTGWKAVRLKT